MGYYKTTTKQSSRTKNIANRNNFERIILGTFLFVSVLTIVVSIIIAVGEISIAYYELFGDDPYSSLAPTLTVAFLVLPQFIGIIISLILKKWLEKRNLLTNKNRKLSLMPIRLFYFNLLLAVILALIVNISNGNLAQWVHR